MSNNKEYNYMDYFASDKFDDLGRLSELIGEVLSKFESSHRVDSPVISPDFSLVYKDSPFQVDVPLSVTPPSEVIDKLIPFYKNCVNWGAPGAMFNVTPPSNILGVAINVLSALLNPNLAEDRSGGLTAFAEQEVVKCLGRLIKWPEEKVTGMSCYGGKATNLYASRNAILNCKAALGDDFKIENAFYISSDRGHPCQVEGALLQGVTKENNIVIPCEVDGKIKLDLLKAAIEKNIENGKTFLGITINAGTTMEYIVDDIPEVVRIRDEIVTKYNLSYHPNIHADAVLGWVWLFVDRIDEVKIHNPETRPSSILKVKQFYEQAKNISMVDSIGVDFHKLGYTAYQSSFYVSQSQGKRFVDDMKFSQLSTYRNTLELSRGAQGVMGALASLLSFGYEGYVNLIVNLINSVEEIRSTFDKHPMLAVLDPGSLGVCNVVTLTHKKPLVESELSDEDIRIINDMNEKFIRHLQKKLEKGETGVYSSFSKSYLAPGSKVRYGGIKLYATSPHLANDKLREFMGDFLSNVDEFLVAHNYSSEGHETKNENKYYHPIF